MYTPEVMVALDLNFYWSRVPYEFVRRLRDAGCVQYKVHDPLPSMDLKTTVMLLKRSALPGQTVTIMFDNKECDIPSRVVRAVENHIQMGFSLTTVHARGGLDTLKELEREGFAKHVVVVTALTSEKEEDLYRVFGKNRAELELLFAKMAVDAGMQGGIVCSAQGIPAIRPITGNMPFIIPGVHFSDQAPAADQQTSVTPRAAATFGATSVVMGRSIIGTEKQHEPNPERMFARAKKELMGVSA